MQKVAFALMGAMIFATPALAKLRPFPAGLKSEMIKSNGTHIYFRVGGKVSAVVLLHGYGETGDMWTPLAADLARDHTVIAPDLRGTRQSTTALHSSLQRQRPGT
jgi:pimeloyl-ACP methyl ester carboxylesterase